MRSRMEFNPIVRQAVPADKIAWDALVQHPLQSWAWGEFRQAIGTDVVRCVVEKNKKITDAWQLTFHRLPYTPFTVGYFPKGPFPTKQMFDELTKLGERKRSIFIQLEPNIIASSQSAVRHNQLCNTSHHPLFTKYTFVLDLTKSEDELLSAMNQKTRYNIRLAQKHGVVVKEDNSARAFADYLRLTNQTTQRQHFYAHNQLYHEHLWEILSKAGIAHLFTASLNHETLAAWILFGWKETLYYPYGASSREHREVMAPHLLLWKAAVWAKERGFKYFDLWGALGPDPDPSNPWYGFHHFKEGYKPRLVEFVGSYDLVINQTVYEFYKLADSLRWFVLKLRR